MKIRAKFGPDDDGTGRLKKLVRDLFFPADVRSRYFTIIVCGDTH